MNKIDKILEWFNLIQLKKYNEDLTKNDKQHEIALSLIDTQNYLLDELEDMYEDVKFEKRVLEEEYDVLLADYEVMEEIYNDDFTYEEVMSIIKEKK